MNREIKFRAWDNEKQKMVNQEEYGYYDCYGTQEVKILNQILGDPEKEFVFMQFTGLKDKNGIDIYEGDVLRYIRSYSFGDHYNGEPIDTDRTTTIIGKIVFYPSKGFIIKGFYSAENDIEGGFLFEKLKYGSRPSCIDIYGEIIGNIFENSELLKL